MTAKATSLGRKVLLREDFGLCVFWPKTHWQEICPPGKSASVLIDGKPRRVKVQSERCIGSSVCPTRSARTPTRSSPLHWGSAKMASHRSRRH